MSTLELDSTRVAVNGIDLHVKQGGPEDGTPVVFLHGFPEFWYGWRNQLEFFVERGYRVIVPDQRGYNRSDKPTNACEYRLDRLVDDVVELMRYLGYGSVDLVSHDWGAIVGWVLAEHYPGTVSSLTVMNVGHPGIFESYITSHPSQFFRSIYMFLFVVPCIPELILGAWDHLLMRKGLEWSSRADTFTTEDIRKYVTAWKKPDALRSMINWYRASLIYSSDFDAEPTIECPVQILWGQRDQFLETELAELCAEKINRANLTLFSEASHWIHHEIPEKVNAKTHEFIERT